MIGSSPRVRGTRGRLLDHRVIGRFIPACAGNTTPPMSSSIFPAVHPRVCGEHSTRWRTPSGMTGSSPRVRGTLWHGVGAHLSRRFIPACAGNTTAGGFGLMGCAVHPRVCGEHRGENGAAHSLVGSSPRVRGTQSIDVPNSPCLRFIPACAGNTTARTIGVCRLPVHPRVCGEHDRRAVVGCRGCGSSPRVRGTPPYPQMRQRLGRFIPACAGNTQFERLEPMRIRGSSPRVRGTQGLLAGVAVPSRFIPACAGNTHCPTPLPVRLPVHPRVCGEHQCRLCLCLVFPGSSPRVRGTPRRVDDDGDGSRFIPACAGNTRTNRHTTRVYGGSSPRVRGTQRDAGACLENVRFIPACAGNTGRHQLGRTSGTVHPRVCGEHPCSPPFG